jgi:DNA-directed RNA polymerase specialized sigma24 family protein
VTLHEGIAAHLSDGQPEAAIALLRERCDGELERYLAAWLRPDAAAIARAEVWQAALASLPAARFEGPHAPRSWLLAAARRRVQAALGERGERPLIALDDAAVEAIIEALATGRSTPPTKLLHAARAAAVREVVRRAEPDDAELVFLRVALEMKPLGIAAVRGAGEQPSVISQRVRRVLARLWRELSEQELFAPAAKR